MDNEFQIEPVAELPVAVRGPGRPMRPDMAAMIDEGRRQAGVWLSRTIDGKTASETMASYGRTLRRHGFEAACRTQDGVTKLFWRQP